MIIQGAPIHLPYEAWQVKHPLNSLLAQLTADLMLIPAIDAFT